MRASVLFVLLLASLTLPFMNGAARAAVGAAVLPAAHFDAGRQALRDGRYENALHELMLAVMAHPDDEAAREYMRRAAETLAEQDLRRVSSERRALLEAYRDGLDVERRRAEAWTAWLLQADAARKGGRWAEALDDAQRVVDDNPLHRDAKEARRSASYGLSRALGYGSRRLSRRDLLVYRGLFSVISSQPERARRFLSDALALGEGEGELEDARVRYWLAKVTPVVAAPKPILPPAPKPEPKIAPKPKPKRRPAVVVAPKPAIDPAEQARAEVKARLEAEEKAARDHAEAERQYSLGLMLYAQGKRVEAIERWKQAVALDPGHGFAARALSHAQKELEEEAK